MIYMHYKPFLLMAAASLVTLSTTSIQAQPPASYEDIIRAERARMIDNFQKSGGETLSKPQQDETWLTNTPGTWGYIINSERLRMKSHMPQSASQPAQSKTNVMPTTLNERVRLEHEEMKSKN
jgi:hypothetical protein